MKPGQAGRFRHVVFLLAAAAPLAQAACSSAPLPTNPTVVESPTRYRLSGRVTDENGSPMAGVVVEVDHGRVGASTSTSNCPVPWFCWIATRTNAAGEYAVEFEAGSFSLGGIGYVYSWERGYETDIQWVPTTSRTVTQDLRLVLTRPIAAGQSTSVSVGPGNALCTDLEDTWQLDYRCAAVTIEANTAGTMTVDVTTPAGDAPPVLFWAATGNYSGPPARSSDTTLSIPVGGGTYIIFVGTPEGTPTRAFDVVTAFR